MLLRVLLGSCALSRHVYEHLAQLARSRPEASTMGYIAQVTFVLTYYAN